VSVSLPIARTATRCLLKAVYRIAGLLAHVEGTLTHGECFCSLIGEYLRTLKARGKFEHVAAAIVLDPAISRTAFHLIYATRNRVERQMFKAAEKNAMATRLETIEKMFAVLL
jgi:hypothetical protein